MVIERTSPITGERNFMNIDVTDEQIKLWKEGMLIQDAMPNLSDDEREFIMTGITPAEWSRIFENGTD